MPLQGVRYRVKETPKGKIRLAFKGNKVVEATKLEKQVEAMKKKMKK